MELKNMDLDQLITRKNKIIRMMDKLDFGSDAYCKYEDEYCEVGHRLLNYSNPDYVYPY